MALAASVLLLNLGFSQCIVTACMKQYGLTHREFLGTTGSRAGTAEIVFWRLFHGEALENRSPVYCVESKRRYLQCTWCQRGPTDCPM